MNITTWGQDLVTFLGPIFGELSTGAAGRLILTLVLCGLIGLERASHDRAAGFRPHILVGVGACVMTLAGGYGFAELGAAGRDPLRVASYVVSGIGFLGAGAILRHGASVRGLTTAATLWLAAGLGIAVGAGLGTLAVVTVALVLFTLGPLQQLESRLHLGGTTSNLTLQLTNDRQAVGKTLAALDRLGVPVRRATIVPGEGATSTLQIELGRALSAEQAPLLVRRLLTLKYIERVETVSAPMDPDDIHVPVGGSPAGGRSDEAAGSGFRDVVLTHDLDGDGGAEEESEPPTR